MARRRASAQSKLFQNNLLVYGDNLKALRNPHLFRDESVDLVYLDPPFKPSERHNVLFRSRSGTPAVAQSRAFEDTWHWDEAAKAAYHDAMENAPLRVRRTLEAFETILTRSDMFAYLCMMAPRLVELHNILRSTGSIYLHCDPSASHYLKALMDAVFGPEHFRNEIIWKRAMTVKGNFGQGAKFFDRNVDSLLFYTKSDSYTFNQPFKPYSADYIKKAYRYVEPETGRRYRLVSMIGPGGASKGNPRYEVMGVTKYWRYSEKKMQELIDAGLVVQTKEGGVPHKKQYLDEGKGVPIQSLWEDIRALQAKNAEQLGYPTQKPEELLERVIATSSNPGDVVLDPFCGCGTTVAAAQNLGRKWVGIDIAYDAIRIIRTRLAKAGLVEKQDYEVWGEPESVEDAIELAEEDKYQFQWWAVRRLGAREIDYKKGADQGIDGRLVLRAERTGDRVPEAIISVKAGRKSSRDHIAQLVGVVEREKAEIGVLVTRGKPTKAMKDEASRAGEYTDGAKWYPRIQLLTAEDIIAGKGVDYPAFVAGKGPSRKKRTRTSVGKDAAPQSAPDLDWSAPKQDLDSPE